MRELPASRKMRHDQPMTETPPAILSHTFDLCRLGETKRGEPPHDITITATRQQCVGLATDFGILAITALSGKVRLQRGPDNLIHATLDLKARVTQACVVTTDPVEQVIAERASLILLTQEQAVARDIEHMPIDPDAPDEIAAEGTIIDLGAILTEQVALALDPYPRKPDAVLPDELMEQRANPFSALTRLRDIATIAVAKKPDGT
jgi:hypothetical protein